MKTQSHAAVPLFICRSRLASESSYRTPQSLTFLSPSTSPGSSPCLSWETWVLQRRQSMESSFNLPPSIGHLPSPASGPSNIYHQNGGVRCGSSKDFPCCQSGAYSQPEGESADADCHSCKLCYEVVSPMPEQPHGPHEEADRNESLQGRNKPTKLCVANYRILISHGLDLILVCCQN
jgi:hypothetical protein